MRVELPEHSARHVQEIVDLTRVTAFSPKPIRAVPKLVDPIFGIRDTLGNAQQIRRDAPHNVYPLVNRSRTISSNMTQLKALGEQMRRSMT
jgi:predicted metal-dependent RNase